MPPWWRSRPLSRSSAGFLIFRGQIRQQIVAQTARRSFGSLKLNVLILGYQADEATTDTIVLAHLDVVASNRDARLDIRATRGSTFRERDSQRSTPPTLTAARTPPLSVVGKLLGGVPIDAIVALQPEGAAAIVDAIGGLDVNVDEAMNYDDNAGALHIHLRPGDGI